MNDRSGTTRSLTTFAAEWQRYGVSEDTPATCPRRCGRAVVIDWMYGSFHCHRCCYSGIGLRDLVLLRPRLADQYREDEEGIYSGLDLSGCPKPFRQLQTRTGEARIIPHACKTKGCTYCYEKHVRSYMALLSPVLTGQTLFKCSDDRKWDALRKAIDREGGDYIRIPSTKGTVVITNVPVKGAVELNKPLTSLELVLLSAPPGRARLSASKPWQFKSLDADHQAKSTEALATLLCSDYEPWRPLTYGKVGAVERAFLSAGIITRDESGEATIADRKIMAMPLSGTTEYRHLLYRAGITDPEEPGYVSFDPSLWPYPTDRSPSITMAAA